MQCGAGHDPNLAVGGESGGGPNLKLLFLGLGLTEVHCRYCIQLFNHKKTQVGIRMN